MKATLPILMLAEGLKPRARRAPRTAPKEYRLQTDVADVLKDYALPEWRWSHFPAGERRDVRTGARLKRMGLQRGWPDFQLVSPRGLFHALELKRLGEDLTDEQQDFQLWCCRFGVPHSVAYSFDEALAALSHWGCLRIAPPKPLRGRHD
jgi:hypothetical protein